MKSYLESLEISNAMSDLFSVYQSNSSELSKLLNEATDYLKEDLGLGLLYGQAGPRSQGGWYEKLQPKQWAHSIFFNNKVNNEDNTDPNKSDWLIILMILLKEHSLNEKQECICLSFVLWNCINTDGARLMGNEWEYQAIVSMKRKDWCEYSLSDWSNKVIKTVRKDNKNIAYLLNIPIGCFEGADDFPLILKPVINSLMIKNDEEIRELTFYIPEYIK